MFAPSRNARPTTVEQTVDLAAVDITSTTPECVASAILDYRPERNVRAANVPPGWVSH